ncbi:MAG TPA: DNA recombination protein RmuC [Xanthobacteraceae bacterium]|jgi:DNA recombination protein RmuC|nr:DNA recombination protein RmuC [Xanthobacteraceae bacterium]
MPDSLPMLAVIFTACAAVAAGVAVLGAVLWRARRAGHPDAAVMAELSRAHSDTAARLEAMIGMLAKGQTQLAHSVNDRLDSVSHRLGDSLEKTKQSTVENLQKLNERLAVIDHAQKNITELATQVTSLQSVLANKQSRGAFGQGRMEIIVRDGLPMGCYEFQHTLSNRLRPDCVIFMPDNRPLVVDSKFPLEAVTAFRDAKSDDERKLAAARVRQDVIKHVGDIAQKYLLPGETQDMAFMFVPSESVYAELHEEFDDVVQKAFRAKIVIVSPSLLMLAIQLVRQNQKDARMREAADQIRDEVGRLVKDVGLLGDRVRKLQTHFNQATEDIRLSVVSIEKIESRGERITQVELQGEAQGELNGITSPAASNVIAAPMARKLEAGE